MNLTTSSLARLCGAAALLASLFGFAGCGSSSMGSSDPAAAFTGSWTFGSGSIMPNCTGLGASLTPFDLTGDTMTITHTSATEVSTMLNGTGVMCDVNFNVSGSTATAVSGQTCVVATTVGGQSLAVNIDISSWTLTVSGDTMTMSMNGTANATLFTCTPTADGAMTRVNGGG